MSPELTLIAMIGAHAFLDYAGQGDFMSKAKNRTAPIPGVPWWNILAAHATIQGAAVALITGIWWLFIAEAIIHFVTDDAKCRGKISFNTDQAIHIACKFVWLALVAKLGGV
jgi:hypothetical protein